MEYVENSLGNNVLEDWDNLFDNHLMDYFTTKEKIDGWWFTLSATEKGVYDCDLEVLPAAKACKLHLVTRSIKKNLVYICVVVGPGINGNPYNLTANKYFIVDIWDKDRNGFYTVQELLNFVSKISINVYGGVYNAGPVIGVVRFNAIATALKELGPEDTTAELEAELLSGLNALVDMPSAVNPAVSRRGILCQGVFGYDFYYE